MRTFLKIGEVVLNYELESIAYAKSTFRNEPANSASGDVCVIIIISSIVQDIEIG